VEGELDAFTASDLRAELCAVEAAEPKLIVIDLRAVQFLDSSGLAVILGARQRAVEAVAWNLELIIAGSSAVEEMFAAIRADSLLTIAVDPGPAAEEPRDAAVVSATQTG
jgi:anti-anti-sigma factor